MSNCFNSYNDFPRPLGFSNCSCVKPCGNNNGISGFNTPNNCYCGNYNPSSPFNPSFPCPPGPPAPPCPIDPPSPAVLLAYNQYVTSSSTLAAGSLALTPVIENGGNFITTAGNSIILAPGAYEINYSLSGTTGSEATTVTVTPSINSVDQIQYAANYADSTDSTAFTIGNSFIVTSPTTQTVTFNLALTGSTQLTTGYFIVSVKRINTTVQ